MKLYLVHCGYYDSTVGDGVYEFHVNFMVAAENFDAAKIQARNLPDFKAKRMHIDGLQEIEAVDGFRITLTDDKTLNGKTLLINNKHRDLATKPA